MSERLMTADEVAELLAVPASWLLAVPASWVRESTRVERTEIPMTFPSFALVGEV